MPTSRSHKRRASDPGIKNSVNGSGRGDDGGGGRYGRHDMVFEDGSRMQRGLKGLEGEITLGKDLKPSCGFALFSVQNTVDMLAFVSKLFQPNPLLFRGALDHQADP